MRSAVHSFGRRAWAVATSRRLRWPRRIGLALGGLVVVACAAWWIAVRVVEFPRELLDRSAATSLSVVDDNGVLLRQEATSAGLRERWISLDKISPHLVNATLASEDNDFHDHAGVDWTAIGRAVFPASQTASQGWSQTRPQTKGRGLSL